VPETQKSRPTRQGRRLSAMLFNKDANPMPQTRAIPGARQDDSPPAAERCANCAASEPYGYEADFVWCCHPDRCINIFDGVIPRREPADFRCDLWLERAR
jgi:hypothetical protein